MKRISTILIPYDFSESAKKALEYAVAFVGPDDDINIALAHISDSDTGNLRAEDFKKIEEVNAPLLKNKLEWITQGGSLTQSVLDIQETKQIDLVIMGTSGTDKARDTDQSNTSKIVLATNCSVLAVPSDHTDFQIKRIALVLGKQEIDDTEVLGTLLEIARRFNAKVDVVTIKNSPELYGYSEADKKNENTLQYYLENFYSEHAYIENTDLVEGILTYATSHQIDLIAILPRNHAKHSTPSDGELTEILTLNSKVPVLAID